MKKWIVVVIAAVIVISVTAFLYQWQRKSTLTRLFYSGMIEATESQLAFQAGGRVVEVLVDEGYQVEKDQVLAILDQAEYQARYEEAQAGLEKAKKSLEQLETQLGIYQTSLPADVTRAEANFASAKDTYEETRKNKERYDALVQDHVVSERDWDTVTLNYDNARARLTETEALLLQARSNLGIIDASQREIEAAQAQVQVAEASLTLATIQRGYTMLKAPYGGVITSRNVELGEVISPNREVLTLADLSTVDLKIFVDETDLGHVKPGQPVDVRIDSFPDRTYQGTVGFISPQGEFTPKIIQTHKERVKLVYLVKVIIPNSDFELKTGMPADAWLK